jgi:hypothetical protein
VVSGAGWSDWRTVARVGWFDAHAAASAPPATPVAAAKNARRDNPDTSLSVS